MPLPLTGGDPGQGRRSVSKDRFSFDMNLTLRKIALIGLFTALGATLGYALTSIPNVELVTATIFVAGYLMGIRAGLLVGLLTESIYSLLNPYGVAAPPLFIAQVVAMGLAGCVGGWLGKRLRGSGWRLHLNLGLAGLGLTLFFAVFTTLSFLIFIDLSSESILSSFIVGMGFYLLHIISNILIFITAVPLIIRIALRSHLFSDITGTEYV